MTPQSLFRTSAIIYADQCSSRRTVTIKKKFIEAVFINNQNSALTIDEIAIKLHDDMRLDFTDPEISSVVNNQDCFIIQQIDLIKAHDKYCLTAKRYNYLLTLSGNNIDECITQYLQEKELYENSEGDYLKELLQRYLYLMMNSNINAYNQILSGSSKDKQYENDSLISEFTDKQIIEINDFLSWSNSTKDKVLYSMVSCCIEYAIVSNNTTEKNLIQSLQNKTLYLDNAFIYRAIGINGDTRKQRTLAFISKCLSAGQKLKVTKYTREEFSNSIDYQIEQLNNSTPFGRINPQLFQKYSNGESIYQFYHKWRTNRITYGFNTFKSYIISEYNNLINTYGIEEDYHSPINENNDEATIGLYANQISLVKKKGHYTSHNIDAKNMLWVEKARNGIDGNLIDTKYFFITPDQKLILWDSSHSKNQPITILPSQWLALILKYTSRSNNDYMSFVSFLKLPHNETDLTPDDIQMILAGISEVTEEWKHIQKNELNTLREDAKIYAKEKLEEYYNDELRKKSQEMANELAKQRELSQEQISTLQANFNEQLLNIEKKNEIERISFRLDFLKRELNTLQKQLVDTTTRHDKSIIKCKKKYEITKKLLIIIAFIITMIWIGVILHYGWNKMEKYTYILGIVISLFACIYFVFYEKKCSIKRLLLTIESLIQKKVYAEKKNDEESIESISHDILYLRKDILELEKDIDKLSK